MTTVVFCNEKAGTFESCNEQMGSISERFEEITGDPTKIVSAQDFHESDLVGVNRAIVMGGDGTVGRLLGKLANHTPRIPVGIIPAGTGNLLAGMLGLKTEKPEDRIPFALETIRKGRVVSIDLGIANGTPFALDVGIGPIAMAVTTPGKSEKNMHGLLSYVRPLIKSMFEHPYKFELKTGGHRFECIASAIFITNPQELGIGQKSDATTLRNGKLNLIVLNPQNLDDYAGIAMRFGSWFLGNAETDKMPYKLFEVDEVEITALEEIQAVPVLAGTLTDILTQNKEVESVPLSLSKREQPATMLDGDVFGHTPVVVASLPAAVDVFVPEHTAV